MKPFPVKPFAQAFTRGLWGLAMSLSVDAGADVGVAMSLTVDAGADAASSLDEDSEFERCSPSRELIPDSGHCETQEVSEVNVPPLDVSAPPLTDTRGCGEASSSGVWCRGRLVQHPYLQRDDVGSYGVYVGSWSGRRKLAGASWLEAREANMVARAWGPRSWLRAKLMEPQGVFLWGVAFMPARFSTGVDLKLVMACVYAR